MTAETSRPKVILLAGFPNSGTTIASYILGQHANIFATGELYGFPSRQLKPLKVCSCGTPAVACPFWADVAAALVPLADASAAVRAQAVYASVCRHSGRPFIVDVAHDLRAVRAIRAIKGIDLSIIHLRRRRLAVLRSRLNLKCRQGDIRPYTLGYVYDAMRHTRRLHHYQRTVGSFVKADGPTAIEISYEELCEAPAAPLARIGELVGLDFHAVVERLASGKALDVPEHMIRGNARLHADAVVHVARR